MVTTQMDLTPEQAAILKGESGDSMAKCLATLVRYGEAFGAKRLLPIKSAHLTGSFRISSFVSYYKLLEQLVEDGIRVSVPTTINPHPGFDFALQNRVIFRGQKHHEEIMDALGVTPNYSCVCYFDANVPQYGDILGWAESSAIIYANSIIGARSNRNSIMVDVCMAILGLAPEFGYLLDDHRRGQVHIKLDIDKMDAPALGFLIGKIAVDRVPVLDHHPFSTVELKNMGAAMASSGGVTMFHVAGLTPEAPDLETAFGGPTPEEVVTISQKDLDNLRASDAIQKDSKVVVFGCPQMTLEEAQEVGQHFVGKQIKKPTLFHLMPDAYEAFMASPLGRDVKASGVKVYQHCPLAGLSLRIGIGSQQVLTPSGKLYYYLEGTKYADLNDVLEVCGVV